jgi:hypothetical protein
MERLWDIGTERPGDAVDPAIVAAETSDNGYAFRILHSGRHKGVTKTKVFAFG